MTDESERSSSTEARPIYPPEQIPTVFVDGIVNLHQNGEVVKFYLSRADPSLTGVGEPESRSVAQVVMPLSGFVASALFIEYALEGYVANGLVSEDRVKQLRKIVRREFDGASSDGDG